MQGKRVGVTGRGTTMRRERSRQWFAIAGAVAALAFCGVAAAQPTGVATAFGATTLHAPADSTIPAGPMGDAVRLGRNIFNNPQGYVKGNVGNGLTCSNCHLNGGTQAWGGPLIGVWGVFPAYSARSASVQTLEDRLNDCFLRSMNRRPHYRRRGPIKSRCRWPRPVSRLRLLRVVAAANGSVRRRACLPAPGPAARHRCPARPMEPIFALAGVFG